MKKWGQVIRSAAPVTQNHLTKLEDLTLQNATLSGNLRPDLLTCLLYCGCHAKCIFADPLQMSHTCQRFWNCCEAVRFGSLLGRCRISCACHAKPHTFKSGPNPVRFEHDMCFAPQPRALYISILKSARNLRCFYTFGFQMCIAPQWRALFNSSTSTSAPECSKHVVFFEHSDFEMCFAPQRRAFFHLSLARWLRTRRFSEPTFRSSGATNHWKNTDFCDFATFSHTSIFFLLFSSLLWLFPSLLFHPSILSEVWLLSFLRTYSNI